MFNNLLFLCNPNKIILYFLSKSLLFFFIIYLTSNEYVSISSSGIIIFLTNPSKSIFLYEFNILLLICANSDKDNVKFCPVNSKNFFL